METGSSGKHPVLTARQQWIKRETAQRLRLDMTPSEKGLWQHLRANRQNGLRFYRQQVIEGFIADFYCNAAQLIVEVDGSVHNAQAEYDAERIRIFAQRGLLTLRFTNAEVDTNVYGVTKTIRLVAQSRLASTNPTSYRNLPA